MYLSENRKEPPDRISLVLMGSRWSRADAAYVRNLFSFQTENVANPTDIFSNKIENVASHRDIFSI